MFRDRFAEQRFLGRRHLDPTRAPRLLTVRHPSRASEAVRRRAEKAEKDTTRQAALSSLWNTTIELGRLPEADEYDDANATIALFGSWKRALNAMLAMHDSAILKRAAAARMEELRLYFAMQAFERRRNRILIDPRLKRDVRTFFGSVASAEAEGFQLLKRTADIAHINAACESAASEGLGWLDGEHSLQLHTSLVKRLAPVLRAYIGCATSLYGDVSSTDLIKIHIQSGKVSLMKFDDFEGSPVPRMLQRVKIKLREQDLDYFEYGGDYPSPPLYFKSRYINEEFVGYAEQLEFDTALEELGVVETTGFGPSDAELAERTASTGGVLWGCASSGRTTCRRWIERCGKVFSFRQLIQCGDTWQESRTGEHTAST